MPDNILDIQNIVTAKELKDIVDRRSDYLFAHPEKAGNTRRRRDRDQFGVRVYQKFGIAPGVAAG